MYRLYTPKFILSFLIVALLTVFAYKAVSRNYKSDRNSELRFLSKTDYRTLSEELRNIAKNDNPKTALKTLTAIIATNSAALRSCHVLTHEIGHEAYMKYKDFGEVMIFKDEVCNSGYMHGVIESHFYKSTDIVRDIKTLCHTYPDGKFLSWECYHGIGHGVMYYTSNDLPKSLALCDSFDNSFAKITCVNGVFMENFNTDQKLHPSKFLNEQDPFYPCPKQAVNHKGDCYMYAPAYFLSINKGKYSAALDWCKTAENSYQQVCAGGVGSQAMKENIDNPKMVEALCSEHQQFNDVCISSMVRLYINHYGGLKQAEVLCKQLDVKNRKICTATVARGASLF